MTIAPLLIALAVLVLLLLYAARNSGSPGEGESTAGHYDPDAIGGYTLDPATMAYRFDLPATPRTGQPTEPGNGPPRRRRRRTQPPAGG